MPIYDYQCPSCGAKTEAVQSFGAAPPLCKCGVQMERLFPCNVLIKWKGFYPKWVDRLDDRQKREVDSGKEPTLPPITELG